MNKLLLVLALFPTLACSGAYEAPGEADPVALAPASPPASKLTSEAPSVPRDGLLEACGAEPPAGPRLLLGPGEDLVLGLRAYQPVAVCVRAACLLAETLLEDGLQVNREATPGCFWTTSGGDGAAHVSLQLEQQGVLHLTTANAAACELGCAP